MLLKLIPILFKYLSPIIPRLSSKVAMELFCRIPKSQRKKLEHDFWMTGENLNLNSGRVAKSWGEGPIVWFLHGWSSKGSTYYKIIPAFVKAGFKVIAWDGPAHGDSPGKRVHLVSYSQAAAEDIKQYNQPIHALIGHSFGGASVALLYKLIPLPPHIVTIGAPTDVFKIFENYQRLINLSNKAYNYLIARAEKEIEQTIDSLSLITNDISKKTKIMVVHDEDDKEVPFKRFTKLKGIWAGGTFYSTKGLGHNRILKDQGVAQKIIEFIKT